MPSKYLVGLIVLLQSLGVLPIMNLLVLPLPLLLLLPLLFVSTNSRRPTLDVESKFNTLTYFVLRAVLNSQSSFFHGMVKQRQSLVSKEVRIKSRAELEGMSIFDHCWQAAFGVFNLFPLHSYAF